MMRRVELNPFNSIISILIMLAVLVGLYYVIKGFFTLLGIITPALLIGAAILNWKVFPDYGRWILRLLKENVILGVLAIVFTVALFPIVAGWLFVKSYFRYRRTQVLKQHSAYRESEFVDYEEIIEIPEEPMPLPKTDKPNKTADYDQLFD